MPWGALISGGMSLASGLMGMGAAADQQALAYKQLQAEQNHRNMMYAMGQDAQKREDELFDYYMDLNNRNQGLLLDQMNYERDWVQQNRDFLLAEQDYERYRISEADRLSAQERVRQLEKLANDQSISKAERARAMEELEYTRSVALGERQYDIKKYEADQQQQMLEYQQRLGEYERMLGIANDERQFMINRQEEILRQAGLMDDEIQRTLSGFGDITPAKRYGEDDVLKSEGQFLSDYMADADRAADRIASVNEAGLIRAGVDVSSTGDSSRRDLLREQITPLYNQARINARNDALAYVTGLQDNEIAASQAELDARAGAMQEIIQGTGNRLNALMSLGDPGSVVSNDYLNLGSGILDPRTLTSAGDYSAPININSEILNRTIDAMGMSNQIGTNTSAAGQRYSGSNGVMTPQFGRTPDASGYMTGGRPSSDHFRFLASGATSAGSNAMENLKDGFANLSSIKWGDLFGSGSGSSSPAPESYGYLYNGNWNQG